MSHPPTDVRRAQAIPSLPRRRPIVHRLRQTCLRLLLWGAPLALAAALGLATRLVEVRGLLSEAGAHLAAGDSRAARQSLAAAERATVRFLHPQRRAAFAAADILGGGEGELAARRRLAVRRPAVRRSGRGRAPEVDARLLPVALITRSAFERGDFRAALRLTALADRLGLPTVPLVAAAALIEDGRSGEARAVLPLGPPLPGGLARRVAHHLRNGREHRGGLYRDRDGRPIGTVAAGRLKLFDEVAPQLVPRAVAEIAPRDARSRATGAAGSLRLSLDLELSAAAAAAFGSRTRGSIVLLDARSGEILAAVSDRRSFDGGGTPAFEQLREPASIAKLITTTAARRAGLDPDAELGRMRCRGQERYDGQILYCPHIAGPLQGLDRALAVSCNVAFANLGVRVGWRGMLAELLRFGFETPVGPFRGGRILRAFGDDRRLADLAIGLEVTEITPLHAALVAAVVANDGVMPTPTLVTTADGRLGFHPRPLPAAAGRPVVDPEWLPEILGAMESVVRRGTARRVAPPGFPVAMKTGTASDPRYGFHVNYIGVGPMPDPWLAFCVRITDQPTSRKVRAAAREVTWRLLRNLGELAAERGWIDGPREAGPRPVFPGRLADLEEPPRKAPAGVGGPRPVRPSQWPSPLTAR